MNEIDKAQIVAKLPPGVTYLGHRAFAFDPHGCVEIIICTDHGVFIERPDHLIKIEPVLPCEPIYIYAHRLIFSNRIKQEKARGH